MKHLAATLAAIAFATSPIPAACQQAVKKSRPAPAEQPFWVTLGTQGGPLVKSSTAQISNALVVDGRLYLFDVGNGVLRQVQGAQLNRLPLAGVFLTHLHGDHVADIVPVALKAEEAARGAAGVAFVGPPGTRTLVDGAMSTLAPTLFIQGQPGGKPATPPRVQETKRGIRTPTIVFDDGHVRVSAVEVDHFRHNPNFHADNAPIALAYRVEAGGKSFVFTGDTAGEWPGLISLARGADVFISECQLGDIRDGGGTPTHMRPLKIAEVAKAAGVRKVVLTHYTPMPPANEAVLTAAVAQIRSGFGGEVEAGHDLERFYAD